MKYRTTDEFLHFRFQEAFIEEMKQMNGYFYAELDNVTILPENSCNRDIREMRTNNLIFKIPDGRIHSLVEEGYKIYDANGNLSRKQEDIIIEPDAYNETLEKMSECYLYSIEKNENQYVISIDTEDHTYLLTIDGKTDIEEWDRFFNL